MKKSTIKILVFISLIISMIYYVGWVFYISEPKYINNCNKKVEQFDYVSIPEYKYSFESKQEVLNGLVLQVDENFAIIKVKEWSDKYYELDLKKSDYRIIGKGTIYHKVNGYVGFNIMLITQIFIGILSAILIISLMSILKDILD